MHKVSTALLVCTGEIVMVKALDHEYEGRPVTEHDIDPDVYP